MPQFSISTWPLSEIAKDDEDVVLMHTLFVLRVDHHQRLRAVKCLVMTWRQASRRILCIRPRHEA